MKTIVGVLVILLIVLQYQLWFKSGGLIELMHLRKHVAALQQENVVLSDRNVALAAEVQDLKQGHEAIEARARSELGLVKQGELFYQVVETTPNK